MGRSPRCRQWCCKRPGVTVVESLVVLAIVGLLFSMALPAVAASRAASHRLACVNNLKQYTLAYENYSWQYGVGPSQTAVTVSLSPFLEVGPFGDLQHVANDDEPTPEVSACPATLFDQSFGAISYGPFSYISDQQARAVGQHGLLWMLDPSEVPDGGSNTVCFSELLLQSRMVWQPDGTYYIYPNDGDDRRISWDTDAGWTVGVHPTVVQVDAFADLCQRERRSQGSFHSYEIGMSMGLSNPVLNNINTPNTPPCHVVPGPNRLDYRHSLSPSSDHPGGVNVSFVDGRVTFVSDSVDRTLWRAAISANGAEPEIFAD